MKLQNRNIILNIGIMKLQNRNIIINIGIMKLQNRNIIINIEPEARKEKFKVVKHTLSLRLIYISLVTSKLCIRSDQIHVFEIS